MQPNNSVLKLIKKRRKEEHTNVVLNLHQFIIIPLNY
jgi:hypothetical protein